MIGKAILAVSFLAFILERRLIAKHGKDLSRRRLSGFEIARQLLDAGGHANVIVEPGTEKRKPGGVKQLYLPPAVYEGKTLASIARAAREASLLCRASSAVLPFDMSRGLYFFVTFAWLLLAVGLLAGDLRWLQSMGWMIFGLVFFLGLIRLPLETEAGQHAYEWLKQSGYFEVDELVKIKNNLRGLRLEPLAEIFTAPAGLASVVFARK